MKGVVAFARDFPSKYRDVFFIILAYCIFAIGGALYWAAIPILSKTSFHLDAFTTSLIVAIIGAVYLITDDMAGVFIDVVGYRKGAIVSIIFGGVTAVISLFNPSLPLFIIGVVFFALAWNILTIAVGAYVLYDVRKKEEGKVFGAYGVFYKFGTFASTFFIGYVAFWGMQGTGIFFLISIILSLLLVIFFLKPEKRKYEHNFTKAVKEYVRSPMQFRRAWQAMKEFSPASWVYAINGFIGFIFSSTLWFAIPLSMSQFSGDILPSGIVLTVFEFGGIVFMGLGGWLSDRYSRKKLFLGLLLVLCAISFVLGILSNLFLVLSLTFLLAAILDATLTPVEAMMAQVDKNHDKDGTILGFVGVFTDSAFMIGPIMSGLLLDKFGLKGVFVFMGAMVLVNFVLSFILLRNFGEKKYKKPNKRHIVHLGGIPRHHRNKAMSDYLEAEEEQMALLQGR